MIANVAVIDNTVRASATIGGALMNTAHINVYYSAADLFGGAYEYIPMVTAQTIPCSQKRMEQDVTITAIQTRETQDSSGGVHFEVLSGIAGDNYGI